MQHKNRLTFLTIAVASIISGCGSEPPVSFAAKIKPIIDEHCSECHLEGGEGAKKSGFLVTSHESIMKGTNYGPVIVPGDALSSSLYRLVSGKVDRKIRMPHGKQSLPAADVASIEKWILQGAKNN